MEIEDRSDDQIARFVLLRHTLPPISAVESHWDLMLQQGNDLLTLRLATLPEMHSKMPDCSDLHQKVRVERLPNHRLLYLDFEGPIAGDPIVGDRGHVIRLAGGQYLWRRNSDKLSCILNSERLMADFDYLSCGPGEQTWLLVRAWFLRE